jgi:hypothetical protein
MRLDLARIKAELAHAVSPDTLIRSRALCWLTEHGPAQLALLVYELEHVQAERDHYRRALAWYGDANNWRFSRHPKGGWQGAEAADDGHRARAALAAAGPREM